MAVRACWYCVAGDATCRVGGHDACDSCRKALAEGSPRAMPVTRPRLRPVPAHDETGLAEERYDARVAARGWR